MTAAGVVSSTERIRDLLESHDTVAVVGLSTHPYKAAHAIPRVLQACGFRVVPVHPTADEILGERAYPRLAALPADLRESPLLVNVFRPSAEAPGITRQAIEVGADALWLQLGITSGEARDLAVDAGLAYVEDRCIGVDVQRLGVRKCD
jgi:uncharacterized protein